MPNIIKPCRMDVVPNGALDMNESQHQNINYLLKNECGDLEFKCHN